MEIHDPTEDKSLANVGLRLTKAEAAELRDALDDLLNAPEAGWHAHISSADYQVEISVRLQGAPSED